MNELPRKGTVRRAPELREDVPEALARALDESADDLLHDRTEDVGEFLDEMHAKIIAAKTCDEAKGRKR